MTKRNKNIEAIEKFLADRDYDYWAPKEIAEGVGISIDATRRALKAGLGDPDTKIIKDVRGQATFYAIDMKPVEPPKRTIEHAVEQVRERTFPKRHLWTEGCGVNAMAQSKVAAALHKKVLDLIGVVTTPAPQLKYRRTRKGRQTFDWYLGNQRLPRTERAAFLLSNGFTHTQIMDAQHVW